MRRKIRRNFIRLQLFAEKKLEEQSHIDPAKGQAGEAAQGKYGVHSVDKNRPKPDTSGYCHMTAPVASGGFGGKLTPLGWVNYMAGSKVARYKANMIARMEALRHPSFDKYKIVFYVVYCPHSRVWPNHDKWLAQNSNLVQNSAPENVPSVTLPLSSFGGNFKINSLNLPSGVADLRVDWYVSSSFRESLMFLYHGRPTARQAIVTGENDYVRRTFNHLPVRQYAAIINDIFLDRTTQPELPEWFDDVPTQAEVNYYYSPNNSNNGGTGNSVNPSDLNPGAFIRRGSTQSHYWNSYRSQIYKNNDPVDNTSLFTHNVTQQQIDEWRNQAQNEDLSDEEVIAQIRGSRVASENRARIIGQQTFDIDISFQPSTAESGGISLGGDGALSYSMLSVDIDLGGFSAPRDGCIHYLWDVVAADDGICAEAWNRESFMLSWKDYYRPALEAIKDRPMYEYEVRHSVENQNIANAIVGFVDNFSDEFRHPKFIKGDFPSLGDRGIYGAIRDDGAGWFLGYYGQLDVPFAQELTLPSKMNWHGLRQDPRSTHSMQPSKVNYSDYAVHRLLLNRGPEDYVMENRQAVLPQTFSMYGSQTLVIDKPISAKIKRKYIPFGEA